MGATTCSHRAHLDTAAHACEATTGTWKIGIDESVSADDLRSCVWDEEGGLAYHECRASQIGICIKV